MSYTLTVNEKCGYLHVKVTGENSPENVRNYLSEISDVCAQRQCSAVLIEEDLRGPSLGIFDIYRIVSAGSQNAWQHLRCIAYVDVNSEHDAQRMRFAETVAVNRRLNVRLFSTLGDAERWLREVTHQTSQDKTRKI